MSAITWFAALAAVAVGAVSPAFTAGPGRGYPLAGNVIVGAAVVALGVSAPAALASHWMAALLALGATALIPLGVDAWLDRRRDDPPRSAAIVGGDGDGSDPGAALSASAAALSVATCAAVAASICT